jgi:hypothetical protein
MSKRSIPDASNTPDSLDYQGNRPQDYILSWDKPDEVTADADIFYWTDAQGRPWRLMAEKIEDVDDRWPLVRKTVWLHDRTRLEQLAAGSQECSRDLECEIYDFNIRGDEYPVLVVRQPAEPFYTPGCRGPCRGLYRQTPPQ